MRRADIRRRSARSRRRPRMMPHGAQPSRQRAQLRVKAVAGFAACAAAAFPNFLLAVMSWTFAQVLAGCAAYGEAMYPGLVGVGEPVGQRDPMRGPQSEHENPNQLQSRTSGPSEISPIANDGIRGRGRFWYHVRLSPAQLLLLRPKTSSDRRRRAPLLRVGARLSRRFLRTSVENAPRAREPPAIAELRASTIAR